MFGFVPEKLEFLPEHKRTLQSLVIDNSHPGDILPDFEAVLNLIKESGLPLTASEQLPMSTVQDINARLARPLQVSLQRPQQKSYPPIHGLYLLVRASGLTRLESVGKKPSLVLDNDMYGQWQTL